MPPQDPNKYVPEVVTTKNNMFLRTSALLFLIVLIALGYIFQNQLISLIKGGPKKVYVTAREFNPEGTILLSLLPIGSNSTGIYQLDVQKKTLEKIYASATSSSITASPYKATSTLIFATNANLSLEKRSTTPLLQIASYNKNTKTLTQLTASNTLFKRHPVYSKELDSIVFSAKENASTTIGVTNDFGVYMRSNGGTEKRVGIGAMPTLTPDGKSVIVLRKNGLNLLNLTSGSSQLIWPISAGSVWLNSQFSVSSKGTYIAWSHPNQGSIFIMRVNSWAPFKGSVVQKIDAHAFWPVFSPDEGYLAFEEVDWAMVPTKPRLVIFDLITPQKKIVQDLGSFDQSAMFVSSWY